MKVAALLCAAFAVGWALAKMHDVSAIIPNLKRR